MVSRQVLNLSREGDYALGSLFQCSAALKGQFSPHVQVELAVLQSVIPVSGKVQCTAERGASSQSLCANLCRNHRGRAALGMH